MKIWRRLDYFSWSWLKMIISWSYSFFDILKPPQFCDRLTIHVSDWNGVMKDHFTEFEKILWPCVMPSYHFQFRHSTFSVIKVARMIYFLNGFSDRFIYFTVYTKKLLRPDCCYAGIRHGMTALHQATVPWCAALC